MWGSGAREIQAWSNHSWGRIRHGLRFLSSYIHPYSYAALIQCGQPFAYVSQVGLLCIVHAILHFIASLMCCFLRQWNRLKILGFVNLLNHQDYFFKKDVITWEFSWMLSYLKRGAFHCLWKLSLEWVVHFSLITTRSKIQFHTHKNYK